MASSIFNTSAGDGAIWNTSAYPGIFTDTTGTTNSNCQVRTDRSPAYLWRMFLPFDTSALPDGATVTAAVVSLYRDDDIDAFLNADSLTAILVPETQASDTSLTANDYDNMTRSNKGSIAFSSTVNHAYFDITITDLSVINLSGYTKLMLMSSADFNQVQPATGQNVLTVQNHAAAHPPKLTVTYGTDYTQTHSDTITISEPTFTRAFTRTFQEVFTVTEVFSKILTRLISFTDSISIVNSLLGRKRKGSLFTETPPENGDNWTRV